MLAQAEIGACRQGGKNSDEYGEQELEHGGLGTLAAGCGCALRGDAVRFEEDEADASGSASAQQQKKQA